MGEIEILKKLTLATGAISLSLSAFIFYSFGFTVNGKESRASRFPASLITQESPAKTAPISKIRMSCQDLAETTALETKSPMLQFEFYECSKRAPTELINLTNGHQATLFTSVEKTISDLVSLKPGTNEIYVRLERVPRPFTFRINSSN